MIRKILPLLLVAAALVGCVSPERREAAMKEHGQACVEPGTALSAIESCLSGRGLPKPIQHNDEELYFKCGPYWGWPFMASCGGLYVKHKGGKALSWRTWSGLDGV
jgi:hypothetical protein